MATMWLARLLCLTLTSLSVIVVARAARSVPIQEDTLNFVMLGDWGGKPYYPYYTSAEKTISVSMGAKAQEIGSHFTVAMGDNFYDNGVTDVNDKRFKTTFEVL